MKKRIKKSKWEVLPTRGTDNKNEYKCIKRKYLRAKEKISMNNCNQLRKETFSIKSMSINKSKNLIIVQKDAGYD